jgi:hypothetical protein
VLDAGLTVPGRYQVLDAFRVPSHRLLLLGPDFQFLFIVHTVNNRHSIGGVLAMGVNLLKEGVKGVHHLGHRL